MRSPHTIDLGKMRAWLLDDGTEQAAPSEFVGAISEDELGIVLGIKTRPLPKVEIGFSPVLLDTGHELLLIDTGNGEDSAPGMGNVQKHLKVLGIAPGDIRRVVSTHAHGDHFMGNTLPGGAVAFPNATFVMQRAEWDWAVGTERLAGMSEVRRKAVHDNLSALSTQVRFIDGEVSLAPGVRTLLTPGHSPAHQCVIVQSGETALIIAGDAVHHPMHIAKPEWTYAHDANPAQTPVSRRKLFEVAVTLNALVAPYHFGFPGVGRITRSGAGYGWRAAR